MRTAISPHKAVRRRLQRSVLVAISMVAAILVSLPNPAQATDISIPFDELVFGAPGSVASIAIVNVDADMVGRTCDLVVVAKNQSSVHPGNDLIVSTGTSQAVIFGVEDTANGGTSQTYEMLLGSTIAVELRIGQDGMSSLGFDLSFDCTTATESGGPTIGEQVATSSSTTTTVAPASCTTTTGATGSVVGADCCATASGSSAAGATECCSLGADSATTQEADCCSVDGASGGVAASGTECCTQVVGTAATGCAAAETPTTTTTTPPTTSTIIPTTTATTVPAAVAGASTNQQLPETPAAQAVAGSPSYTG